LQNGLFSLQNSFSSFGLIDFADQTNLSTVVEAASVAALPAVPPIVVLPQVPAQPAPAPVVNPVDMEQWEDYAHLLVQPEPVHIEQHDARNALLEQIRQRVVHNENAEPMLMDDDGWEECSHLFFEDASVNVHDQSPLTPAEVPVEDIDVITMESVPVVDVRRVMILAQALSKEVCIDLYIVVFLFHCLVFQLSCTRLFHSFLFRSGARTTALTCNPINLNDYR
jgi:hypothetical protein